MSAQTFSNKYIIFIAILTLTFLVYGNTFLNHWTYDDYPVIVESPDARSLSGFIENHYHGRPLRELTYIVDYKLFGHNPSGYHLQQILWHAGNGFLLFLVLKLVGINLVPSLLGVAFFIIHPIQSESLANLSHRKEILPLFFGILSLLTYLRASESDFRKKMALLLLSGILYVLVLFSNITAITLPAMIVLYEYLFMKQEDRLLLRRPYSVKIILAIVVLVIIIYCVDFSAYYIGSYWENLQILYVQNGFFETEKIFPYVAALFKVFAIYIFKIALPVGLAPEYSVKFSESFIQWKAWTGLALLSAGVFVFFKTKNRLPVVAFGIGWFMIFILPVSNIYPSAFIMTDRYLYMCLPGISFCLAAVLQKWFSKQFVAVFCVVLTIFAVLTVKQNGYWRNNYILSKHAVRVNPDSSGANWMRVESAISKNEYEVAKVHLEKILEINRFFLKAYLHLAKVEEKLGNLKSALRYYEHFARYGMMTGNLQEVERVKTYLPVLKAKIMNDG
jgi:hypothetical protein